MGKILYPILLFFCCLLCACSREIPIEERPMYGNIPATPEVQKIHEKFIKEIESSSGREEGVKAMLYLAWDFFHKGDFKMAMKRFNQAWLLDPNNAEVYFGFARIADKKTKYNEAIEMYSKAINIDPNFGIAYSNRGLCYGHKYEIDKAISDFSKAIELKPDDAQNYSDRSFAYYLNREYEDSLKDVQKAQSLGYKVNPKFILKLEKYLKK